MQDAHSRAGVGALFASLALAAAASAQTPCQGGDACGGGSEATITFTDALPAQGPPWAHDFVVPAFDATLGELVRVVVRTTAQMDCSFGVENLNVIQGCIGGTLFLDSMLDLRSATGGPILFNNVSLACSSSVGPSGAFDGTLDFGGPSGETITDQQTFSAYLCIDDPAELIGFVAGAPGQSCVYSGLTAPILFIENLTCGNLALFHTLTVGVELEVTYTYCPAVGQAYCAGDGSGAPCPCGNAGAPAHGCANGHFASGARLSATGSPSLAADTLTLRAASSSPGQPGLFFQGDDRVLGGAGAPFGDGLRCAGGNAVRLQVVTADATGAAASSVALGAAGGAAAGDLLRYQWWYRDPAGSPCGAGFNLSNGLELDWLP